MSVLVALALDAGLGEPPVRGHPVVWAGRYLDATGRRLPATPASRAVRAGALAWTGGAALAVGAGLLADRVAAAGRRGRVLRGAVLWSLLSARMLFIEVAAVEFALEEGLDPGRRALSRIVSRDTSDLDEAEVRSAAVESLAENLSDSLVAPLFWFCLAGLPGAALYRYANTADASWGYRDARWRHPGRVAAVADDVLNVVPARLTAVLLHGPGRWRGLRREADATDSPNAGWPMAAMALRAGLRLAKRGAHELNPAGADPRPGDIGRAIRLAATAATAACALAALSDHLTTRGARP